MMPITFSKEVQTMLAFYVAWIAIHHMSSHAYSYFCTPNTLLGILMSPFTAAAPHCIAIRWVMYEGGNVITTMWKTIGLYIVAKLAMPDTFKDTFKKSVAKTD